MKFPPVIVVNLLIVFIAQGFVHPGLLHTRQELDLIKTKVANQAQPWLDGYNKLELNPQASCNYSVNGGYTIVGRGTQPGDNVHKDAFDKDCNAAHYNALMWYITDDQRYADKAIQILNEYSYKLEEIVGTDKILMASLNGAKLLYAAEILRYSDSGWEDADIIKFEDMMLDIFYPIIEDFATFANGNWGTGCVKTMMAIGVFCEDREIFDRAEDWYYNGTGNGALPNYIINDTGQCQESGRDQGHVQLGIAHLAEAAEIGWSQGRDMYSALDNRLLKGFEYTAKYNLGFDVPFIEHFDTTGKYHHTEISTEGRGDFRPVYEMVYNHYKHRKGIDCPYTAQTAEQVRPEGANPYADGCGFGTLLFTIDPNNQPLYGDMTTEGNINFKDLAPFLEHWILTNSQSNLDIDDNGIVNFYEFSCLGRNWQRQI